MIKILLTILLVVSCGGGKEGASSPGKDARDSESCSGQKPANSAAAGLLQQPPLGTLEEKTNTLGAKVFTYREPHMPCARDLECQRGFCLLRIDDRLPNDTHAGCEILQQHDADFLGRALETLRRQKIAVGSLDIYIYILSDAPRLQEWGLYCQRNADLKKAVQNPHRTDPKLYQSISAHFIQSGVFEGFSSRLAKNGLSLESVSVEKVEFLMASRRDVYETVLAPAGIQADTVIPIPMLLTLHYITQDEPVVPAE